MIAIGTHLQPRSKGDPTVKVVGVENERYVLQPLDFAANFALGFDEITSAYDCHGYAVAIEPFDEYAAWMALSTEKFRRGALAGDRRAKEQAAEESPEQHFARAAEAAADDG